MTEIDIIERRYKRRASSKMLPDYSALNPYIYSAIQEKERAIIRWINSCRIAPIEDKRVLEIGCGSGRNLLDFLRVGFEPENLVGNELLEERVVAARKRLPVGVRILEGDASEIDISEGPFDIVYQSTVFTSILARIIHHFML